MSFVNYKRQFCNDKLAVKRGQNEDPKLYCHEAKLCLDLRKSNNIIDLYNNKHLTYDCTAICAR